MFQYKALGHALYDAVVRKLQLLESDYFDLEFVDNLGVPVGFIAILVFIFLIGTLYFCTSYSQCQALYDICTLLNLTSKLILLTTLIVPVYIWPDQALWYLLVQPVSIHAQNQQEFLPRASRGRIEMKSNFDKYELLMAYGYHSAYRCKRQHNLWIDFISTLKALS